MRAPRSINLFRPSCRGLAVETFPHRAPDRVGSSWALLVHVTLQYHLVEVKCHCTLLYWRSLGRWLRLCVAAMIQVAAVNWQDWSCPRLSRSWSCMALGCKPNPACGPQHAYHPQGVCFWQFEQTHLWPVGGDFAGLWWCLCCSPAVCLLNLLQYTQPDSRLHFLPWFLTEADTWPRE